MVRGVVLVLLGALLSGCAWVQYKQNSSADTGCDPHEITITDRRLVAAGVEQWTATCPTGVYICTAKSRGSSSYTVSNPSQPDPVYAPVVRTGPGRSGYYSGSSLSSSPEPETTTITTFDGFDFSCRPSATWETETAKDESATNSTSVRTMAGFTFGNRPESAEMVCREAGYEWRFNYYTGVCSGAPESVGRDVSVELSFCDEKVCAVSLQVALGEERTWQASFEELRASLVHTYGPPTKPSDTMPSGCEDRVVSCATGKLGRHSDFWRTDGYRITYEVGGRRTRPLLIVRYRQ